MKRIGLAVLSILATWTVTLTGCGHDCGKGTVENNGECVRLELTCGAGTTLVDGQCVGGVTGCGPFTRLDGETGRCVPSDALCGSGTQLDESTGRCVPSGEVRCGAGTIQVGTTCVVEPSVLCPAGEVDTGDGCVPGGFVQIIHNSPDPVASEVGIYVNGVRFVSTVGALSNDRVAFRAATRFLPFAEGDVEVAVTDPGAINDSAALVRATTTVTPGSRTILVVGGVVDPSGFTGVVQPLAIAEVTSALASSDVADPPGTFRLAVFQGAPDAGTLTFTSVLNTVSFSVSYGQQGSYITLPEGVNAFDAMQASALVTAFQTSAAGGSFAAPDGFDRGIAAVAIASGFVTPQATAPSSGFAMAAALPEGGALQILDTAARFQLAHAAVDAGNVAVFVNHALQVDSWPLYSATPVFAVPSGMTLAVSIAAAGNAETNAVITRETVLAPGDAVAAIASSASAGAGPDAAERLIIVPVVTSTASTTTFSAAVVHAVPDAGAVILRDADGIAVGSSTPITFASATGYSDVVAGTTPFDFFSAAGPEVRLKSVQSSSSTEIPSSSGIAAGRTVLIVATGAAADVDLFALTPEGEFVQLDRAVRVQFINAVQAREAPAIDLLVNGAPLQTNWPFRSALGYRTYALVNDTLPVGVQPAGVPALRVTRDVEFSTVPGDLVYVMTLLGARANGGTNDLYVYPTPGREAAPDSTVVSVNNFNALSDLSPFDVISAQSGSLLFDDCNYATYGRNGFIQLAPGSYVIQIADPDVDLPFIQYYALDVDLTGLGGRSMVVLETGFQTPGAGEPAFAAIAVFSDGTVVTLPVL